MRKHQCTKSLTYFKGSFNCLTLCFPFLMILSSHRKWNKHLCGGHRCIKDAERSTDSNTGCVLVKCRAPLKPRGFWWWSLWSPPSHYSDTIHQSLCEERPNAADPHHIHKRAVFQVNDTDMIIILTHSQKPYWKSCDIDNHWN